MDLVTWLLFGGILLMLVGLVAVYCMLRRAQQAQTQNIQGLHQQIDQLRQTQGLLEAGMDEVRAGGIGLGKQVKTLDANLQQLQEQQQELQQQDPASKFYQQAARLVDAGASLEEVMQECDLPRAEAELLFSLNKRPS